MVSADEGVQTFADKLWNEEQTNALKEEALSTAFISGVGKGTLHPDFYGEYMVQGAVFCAKVAELWQELSLKISPESDEYLKDVATKLSIKYADYAAGLLKRWHINVVDDELRGGRKPFGVDLGKHASDYVKTVEESATQHPAYMLVATFPCLKLWHYLANTLAWAPDQPYAFWIKDNRKDSTSLQLIEKAIEHYVDAGDLQYKAALDLLLNVMQCEIDFFNNPALLP